MSSLRRRITCGTSFLSSLSSIPSPERPAKGDFEFGSQGLEKEKKSPRNQREGITPYLHYSTDEKTTSKDSPQYDHLTHCTPKLFPRRSQDQQDLANALQAENAAMTEEFLQRYQIIGPLRRTTV
ncbi:hypothetical protein PROFUN_08693 [Planoprotostelium fungivorum]|uniref:Uncharacterized protein n=1 Tax=Planoprotostelium fungivorum TaxID=1890364 RepID=A0A2P6MQT2_9EUKA|nr:hypothetical protein PROFUN_08693 [Planoprotostelium fungivorum]